MDFITIAVLGLIVAAFLLFAAVLAYADHATRKARRARAAADAKAQALADNYRKAA